MICKFCGHVYVTPCHGKNEGCGNRAHAEEMRKRKLEKPDESDLDVSSDVPQRAP